MEALITPLPREIETTARRILETATEMGITLATAESCTGGLIGAVLTDVEGASRAFESGFITYSDAAKGDLLGISRAMIAREGVVSKAVALAMAAGALSRSQADIAIAVTGFAGPAGPDDEPGLVHLACIRRGRPPSHREEHFGNIGRSSVRQATLATALRMIEDALQA